ncbi:hypothetical protein PRIPAC_71280 [Pristionchus pacificus]|uniref:Skp1-related protein n=1 Tax=Pristionchus pacificus TaxID=54126 RepID=A0A2A6CSX1_PRIPA|nr:hypothetical protein PRIPAC_71280 [Pristionchus pacificus]|eukprot:PDM81239.1 hypothetical protein PRIPAC_36242 [Pristionchus pacificus]
MSAQVRLVSNDKKEFLVDVAIARMSDTIAGMLDIIPEDEIGKHPIPLNNFDAEVLERVLEWCEQHRHDPVDTKEEIHDGREIDLSVPEWDKQFLQNKSAEEIREYFHVENDYTEAEIKKIKEDQAWH